MAGAIGGGTIGGVARAKADRDYDRNKMTYPKINLPVAMTMKFWKNAPMANTSCPAQIRALKMTVPKRIPKTLSKRNPPNTERTTLGQEYRE